jgi:hypothetical protein
MKRHKKSDHETMHIGQELYHRSGGPLSLNKNDRLGPAAGATSYSYPLHPHWRPCRVQKRETPNIPPKFFA